MDLMDGNKLGGFMNHCELVANWRGLQNNGYSLSTSDRVIPDIFR